MYKLEDFIISKTATLHEALQAIDKCRRRFIVVNDNDDTVCGVLTDGDIRRKLIMGSRIEERVCDCNVCQNDFVSVPADTPIDDLIEVFHNKKIGFVPFLDNEGRLVGLITRGQLHSLVLQCMELPDFDELLNVDEHLMDFEIFQRPWGIYKTTVLQSEYQSKVLQIRPGAQLSLQYHRQREECWTVVSGDGIAQVGNSLMTVHSGSMVFIPRGVQHRLTNTSDDSWLVIAEAQIGDYFGEDDIVRIEDRYGRVPEIPKE